MVFNTTTTTTTITIDASILLRLCAFNSCSKVLLDKDETLPGDLSFPLYYCFSVVFVFYLFLRGLKGTIFKRKRRCSRTVVYGFEVGEV